jgi:two-component sensor histidine kinase
MRVLMVDHSRADRTLCRTLLEEAQDQRIEFLEAASAAEGLNTCRAIAPDCLLLDHELPEMTGLEFLARLRLEGNGDPAFPVVMLARLANQQSVVQALKAGAQEYLIKDHLSADGLSLAIEKATQKVRTIRELRSERDQLARSLAEKEVLFQEVHHRIKNNLQVIASLLRLQASSIGDLNLATALSESQHRVESMALIHEQLYESADLREVAIDPYAKLLLENLLHFYGNPAHIVGHAGIAPLADGRPLALDLDQAIPAGLILNELASNALKHAFPEGRFGCVRIEGHRRNGWNHLTVKDNGVGLPRDFDQRWSKSLGLEIVNILTRQLNGTCELARNGGTAFCVSFPQK